MTLTQHSLVEVHDMRRIGMRQMKQPNLIALGFLVGLIISVAFVYVIAPTPPFIVQ